MRTFDSSSLDQASETASVSTTRPSAGGEDDGVQDGEAVVTRFGDGGDEPFAMGDARVVGSTEKALRVKLDDDSLLGAREIWVPRSVIHDDSEVFDAFNNGRGELVVKRWFARREGWEVE